MSEDASRTCRLDDLLCVLVSQSHVANTQQRHLPATLSSSLQQFVNTHHHLMFADGPLSHQHRHYIALLAAERFKCSSLVCVHRTEFLLHGGDRRWLTSSDGRLPWHVPLRIHNLQELNKILAHRPWTLCPSLISKLRQTDGAMWSLSELTQAIVIVAHVHALSIFLAGCKLYSVDAILDLFDETTCSELPADKPSSSSLVSKVSVIHGKKKHMEPSDCISDFVGSDVMTFHQMKSAVQESSVWSLEDDSAFDDYVFHWPEHRCLLFNHLYPDIGTLLEAEFQSVLSLSSGAQVCADVDSDPQLDHVTIGDYGKGWLAVNHSDEMEAAWLYIQYLFGIHRDQCDYEKLLLQLSPELKAYIKLLVCFPNRIFDKEFEHIPQAVGASALIGMNLLVAEARLETELVYGLYAINKNMSF